MDKTDQAENRQPSLTEAATTIPGDFSDPRKTEDKYIYQPVASSTHIRLLHLLPGEGDAPPQCTLVESSLDDKGAYEAVSYAWGDPNDRKVIICNGKWLSITRNLYEALQVFRLPDKIRVLWADAICINQEDLQERGEQVQRMGRIYLEAENSLLWLGHEDPRIVRTAFEYINRSKAAILERGMANFPEKFIDNDTTSPSALMAIAIEMKDSIQMLPQLQIDETTYHAFTRLLLCPVLRRGWIMQEVILAKSVKVHWGTEVISHDDLATVLLNEDAQIMNKAPTDEDYEDSIAYHHAILLTLQQFMYRHSNFGFDPVELVDNFEVSLFSDPRDVIYGWQGLLILAKDNGSYQNFITPDYTIDYQTVLVNFAQKCIERDEDLRILSSCSRNLEYEQDWPSWVPRWGKGRTSLWLSKYSCGTAHLPISWRESEKGACISVPGIQVASVDSELESFGWADDVLSQNLLQAVSEEFDSTCVAYTATFRFPGPCFFDAYGETEKIDDDATIRVQALHKFLQMEFSENSSAFLIIPSLYDKSLDPGQLFGSMYRHCLRFQKFFRTSDGMLGVAHDDIKEGDAVAILFSGKGPNLPFVLRPSKNLWRLVSPCYIYDLGDGSAVKKWEESGEPAERFDIY